VNYSKAKKECARLFLGKARIVKNPKMRTEAQCAVIIGTDVIGVGATYEAALMSAMQNATESIDRARKAKAETLKGAEMKVTFKGEPIGLPPDAVISAPTATEIRTAAMERAARREAETGGHQGAKDAIEEFGRRVFGVDPARPGSEQTSVAQTGPMGEIRVFDRALTAEEIREMAKAAARPVCATCGCEVGPDGHVCRVEPPPDPNSGSAT
jgi:hypothetical protein